MSDQHLRELEAPLWASAQLDVTESFHTLPRLGTKVRVMSTGSGPTLVLLHGVSLCAAVWIPLMRALGGFRMHAVELPSHGLSDPHLSQQSTVRQEGCALVDDVLDALGEESATVVGHSLGGMIALWHAATGSHRIGRLILIGDPAVALAGTRVRMPLSLMTLPGLGPVALRTTLPGWGYRAFLKMALGAADAAGLPAGTGRLLQRFGGRPDYARAVASLMHAIARFRSGQPTSVLSDAELAGIEIPTTLIMGSADPFLSPDSASDAIRHMPNATVHTASGGHAPWLSDRETIARMIADSSPHPPGREARRGA